MSFDTTALDDANAIMRYNIISPESNDRLQMAYADIEMHSGDWSNVSGAAATTLDLIGGFRLEP